MSLAYIMTEQPETLGMRLRAARKAKSLTQGQLAGLVGLSQQSIGNIEKFSTASLKMSEIADALNVSVAYLKTGKATNNLEIVSSESPGGYSMDDLYQALPSAFDKTIITVRNLLIQRNGLIGGDIPLVANKELFLNVLSKSITLEVTGDLLLSDLNLNSIREDQEKPKNQSNGN